MKRYWRPALYLFFSLLCLLALAAGSLKTGVLLMLVVVSD